MNVVDQEPVQGAEPADERAHGADPSPDVRATITALVRLLARQAAREYLQRLSDPEAGDTTGDTASEE